MRQVLAFVLVPSWLMARVPPTPHHVAGAPTDQRTPAEGTVRAGAFYSRALGVRKHFFVYLPPSYERTHRRYPVVYLLHGLGGSESDWLTHGGIDAVLDSLVTTGMPEAIIVMPDADDGWYTTWARQVPYRACLDATRGEAAERGCVQHQRYDEYIAKDLVAYVDSHYRTLAEPDHRAIGGLSMGGFGAVLLALRFPGTFAAAFSHSGALSALYIGGSPFTAPARYAQQFDQLRDSTGNVWSGFLRYFGEDLEDWRANEPAFLLEALVARGSHLPAIFFDCGASDDLLPQNQAFDWELTRLGIAHQFAVWPGAHTWRYWNAHVRESLPWAVEQIA